MFFPARVQRLGGMLAYIRDSAAKVGFSSSDMKKIELASEEALVNIIYYAYPNNSQGAIDIHCEIPESHCLKIILKDRGCPFNPLENKEPVDVNASLDERKVGGLGVFFICEVMDEVSYQREQDMNVLTLVKKAKKFQ